MRRFTYQGKTIIIELLDDGTLDTLINVMQIGKNLTIEHTHRLDSEFRYYIDKACIGKKDYHKAYEILLFDELENIAKTIIDTDSRYWEE